MRVFLICNPGSGSAPDVTGTTAALERLGVTVVKEEAAAERVVVVGGDGTVAPGAELASQLGVPLAVVPAGTANDFGRAHDLPLDVEGAIELAATGGATTRLELARMGRRPFVNAASAGLSPAAARRAEPLKKVLGPLSYSAGAAAAGVLEDPVQVRATVDGAEAFDGEAWQVTVASSGAFGGGSEIEDADPQDGRLDLVVVTAESRLKLPATALAMRRGDLARQDGVVHVRGDAIELTVADGTPFNVDGEVVDVEGVVRFAADDASFELVVPG